MNGHPLDEIARAACEAVELDATGLTPIKVAENGIYRLPAHQIVARIAKPGQRSPAERELRIAEWLRASNVPAVEPADIPTTFVMVDDHPVTFWAELPEHRGGTATEIAGALRALHKLEAPPILGQVDPFVRLDQRIDAAHTLSADDREWMRHHLTELRDRWDQRPEGLAWTPIHGDAWEGNVVTTNAGTTLFIDLERVSIGPPEWDLTSTAIKHSSFGWIDRDLNDEFARAYGYDITTWVGFTLLRDIREMRMTCMAAQAAGQQPELTEQAQLRLDCLRGHRGSRPWTGWEAIP
ncbi:phosphotransferase enzyme family protein [Nocardia sp. CNY236]|uniref:phosphotransferase enzyme family protein n=1 Tax=Nocardia sp. CNY236 TaxID=1169152 RepID=UPI00040BBC8B|nr:aminoglycoside phosphotransferase family protein [Nocardia sp. CNY236]